MDGTQDSEDAGASKMRVFLSYSRRDLEFVAGLAEALGKRGYLPDFDQAHHDKGNVETGISAEDDWWRRLQEMIEAADAMVFVVTPDSVKSKVCDEEIAYARSLGKRVIAILRKPIDFATAPPRLAAMNVKLNFVEDAAFEASVVELSTALDRDVAWLREQTRLIQAAADWEKSGRREEELLRGAEIGEAEAWSARRPASAPEVSEGLLAFLAESRKAEGEREIAARRQLERQKRLQRWVGGLVAAAAAVTVVGAVLVLQGNRELARRTSAAIAQEAGQAYDQGQYDRALRLGVLASHDSYLSPSVSEAGFEIGKAMGLSRLEARFGGMNGTGCFVMNADGSMALVVKDYAPVLLSRGVDGRWSELALPKPNESVQCGAFSQDGRSFATVGAGGATMWTRPTYKVLTRASVEAERKDPAHGWTQKKLETPEIDPVDSPILTASGRLIGAGESTVYVWTPDGAGGWAFATLKDEQTAASGDPLNYVQASADGKRILSVSSTALLVWEEQANGSWSATMLGAPKASIPKAWLTEDGGRIIVDTGHAIRVLTRERLGVWTAGASIEPENEKKSFIDIAASPDGRLVLTQEENVGVKLWRQVESLYVDTPVAGLADIGGGTRLGFSADGRSFYGLTDRGARVWRIDGPEFNAETVAPVTLLGEEKVLYVAVAGDGGVLATSAATEPVEIWRLAEAPAAIGETLAMAGSQDAGPSSVAWGPAGDQAQLAVADLSGVLAVWTRDAAGKWTAEKVAEDVAASWVAMPKAGTVVVNGPGGLELFERGAAAAWGRTKVEVYDGNWASVTADGRTIVAPTDVSKAAVFTRGADGSWSKRPLRDENKEMVAYATISADGAAIMSMAVRNLSAWKKDAGGAWRSEELEEPYFGIDSVKSGPRGVFVSAGDNGVLLWTPKAGGGWAYERVSGADHPARRAELAPGGRAVVTSMLGGSARVWARRDDRKWIGAELAGGARARAAAFSPDGKSIAVALADGAHVVDAAWLAPGEDVRANRRAGVALAREACAKRLSGAPKLTVKDEEAAPVVAGRAGEDVCAWQPAWYDGVLGVVLGWIG